MKLNSKVTWGLAWAGLAVVVAVPSADFLTGKMGTSGTAAVITSTTEPVTPAKVAATRPVAPALSADPAPVKTAEVTTRVTKNGVTIIPAGSDPAVRASTDPVNKYLKNGKPLPDYLTGGDSTDTAGAATPAPTEPSTTQVAALPTAPVVAPVPFPSTARPPNTPKLPDTPVIVDDSGDQQAAIDDGDITPVPPAGINNDDVYLNSKRARLDRYLEQNGLLNDDGGSSRSSATVSVRRPQSDYDPDGFYLSDGPNGDRARAERRARVERMFEGDQGEDDNQDSGWFNLF